MDISKEHKQLGKYFSNGGQTYTGEELRYKLLMDLGIDKIESDRIISEAVEKGWISEVTEGIFTK